MCHFSLPPRGRYLTLFFLEFSSRDKLCFFFKGEDFNVFWRNETKMEIIGCQKNGTTKKKVSQPALKDERQASCHRCRFGDCSGSGLVLVSTSEIGLISWGVWICCFTETDKLMLWWGWWKLIHHQITFWNLIICDLSVLFITFCKNLYLSKL